MVTLAYDLPAGWSERSAAAPRVTARDRLASTLLYALALHLMIILGVEFDLRLTGGEAFEPQMEITLVDPQRASEPDKAADFLAQKAQQGGGEAPQAVLPTTRLVGPAQEGVTEAPRSEVRRASVRTPPPQRPREVAAETAAGQRSAAAPREPSDVPEVPSAAQLLHSSREIARLSAQLDDQTQRYAKRPRKTFISAATKEYKYAAYMEAWRAKVERVGNLNYPDTARRRGITGTLRLAVELRPDGSLGRVRIRRSSGHPVLDEAALRIVRLAAPYAPFPASIREETDLLVITRTWIFEQGNRLSSR